MKIDKNVPISTGEPEGTFDFLNDMEVGDSFLIDATSEISEGATRRAIMNQTNRTGQRFMSRRVPGTGGVRFWRVE